MDSNTETPEFMAAWYKKYNWDETLIKRHEEEVKKRAEIKQEQLQPDYDVTNTIRHGIKTDGAYWDAPLQSQEQPKQEATKEVYLWVSPFGDPELSHIGYSIENLYTITRLMSAGGFFKSLEKYLDEGYTVEKVFLLISRKKEGSIKMPPEE